MVDDNFLSRWSRRKVTARQGAPQDDSPGFVAVPPVAPLSSESWSEARPPDVPHANASVPEQPPLPTLADVESLTCESDFARFVAPEVSGEVRNAALKKLFSDPHFNVMDGLDTYIDDYNKPDPLPAAMLKKMAHAAYLGLVEPEPALKPESAHRFPEERMAGNASAPMETHDEDPDLRLQSHHPPGSPGSEPGTGEDTRGQR